MVSHTWQEDDKRALFSPACQRCVGDPELALPGKSHLLWTLQVGGRASSSSVSTQGTCLKLTPSFSPPLFVYSFQFGNHLLASPTGLSREIREWDCQ